MVRARLPWLAVATVLLGCGGGGGSSSHCKAAAECDNGIYCDGLELCSPGSPGADAKGCVVFAVPSCFAGTVCSNLNRSCVPVCSRSLLDAPGCVQPCVLDSDCDDGLFCNGTAHCVGAAMAASLPNGDARGCAVDPPPCAAGMICDEAMHTCTAVCADADQDGFADAACGGTDCDDTDPGRNPAQVEVCDGAGKDEDCDPSTFGFRDQDSDGYVSSACCNGTNCGTDCNDTNASVHPGATELCNGIDDSCQGAIDNGVTVPLYVDADRDGYGTGVPIQGCVGRDGYALLGNDCDDKNPSITPGTIVCQPTQGAQAYAICSSAGTYQPSKCSGQQVCSSQPNGLGLCL